MHHSWPVDHNLPGLIHNAQYQGTLLTLLQSTRLLNVDLGIEKVPVVRSSIN